MSTREAVPSSSSDEEKELFRRVAEEQDPEARSRLAETYLDFAKSRARLCYRQLNGAFPLDELESHAFHALFQFIDRYRLNEGVPFEGFASKSLVGEIKRLAYGERFDRFGPKDSGQRRILLEAEAWLRQRFSREVTAEELSLETGIEESTVKDLLTSPSLESIDSTERQNEEERAHFIHENLVDRESELRTLAEIQLREAEESIRDFFQELLDDSRCTGEQRIWLEKTQRAMTDRKALSEGILERRLPSLDRRLFTAAITRGLLGNERAEQGIRGTDGISAHPQAGNALERRALYRNLSNRYFSLPIRGKAPES